MDIDRDTGGSSLVVIDIRAGDGGEVKRVAVNEVGQATSSTILTVDGEIVYSR